MWWGGQPGRNPSRGPGYHGPVNESLTALRRRDTSEYELMLKNALKPFCIDDGVLSRITELFLWTYALDPENIKVENRLSDEALARCLIDIQSDRTPRRDWATDNQQGVWLSLRKCTRIVDIAKTFAKQLQNGFYETPTVPDFDPKEVAGGYDRFKQKGLPTAHSSARLDPKLLSPSFKKTSTSKSSASPVKTRSENFTAEISKERFDQQVQAKFALEVTQERVSGQVNDWERFVAQRQAQEHLATNTKPRSPSPAKTPPKPGTSSSKKPKPPSGLPATSRTTKILQPIAPSPPRRPKILRRVAATRAATRPATNDDDYESDKDHLAGSDEEKPPAKKQEVLDLSKGSSAA
ncbi:hypothetical protein V7S43_016472 [Phytophthora oleae]|uniref:Uncharacterized protein n=1 Tax=Phytophthora oleae TaxID=2107226 RepID=A0ABD3EVN3_9STRA